MMQTDLKAKRGADAPHPTSEEWAVFLSRSLLLLGTSLSVAGAGFFVAANWQDLDRFAKLGLAEATVLVAALAAWRLGLQRLSGRVALTAAAALVGVLIALYGQIYQTGADAWENYVLWAVLILPWVLVGRFSPLALLWVGVVDLALYFCDVFPQAPARGNVWSLVAVGAFNAAILAAWEAARHGPGGRRRIDWLDGTWGPRLLVTASLFALLVPSLEFVFDARGPGYLVAFVLFLLLDVAVLIAYRAWRPHPFILALALAFTVSLATGVGARLLDVEDGLDAFKMLLLAVLLILEITASLWWLRRLPRISNVEV